MKGCPQFFVVGLLAGFFGAVQVTCADDVAVPDGLYEHLVDPVEVADKNSPYFRVTSQSGEGVLVQTLISKDGKCFVYMDQIRVAQATKVSRKVGLVGSMGADEFLRNLGSISASIEAMEKWPAQGSIHPGPAIEFRGVAGQVEIARLDVMDIGSYPKPIAAFLSLFRREFFQSLEKAEDDAR